MKTSGNTVLITGGASGIGLEIAKLFSQINNKLIMAYKSEIRWLIRNGKPPEQSELILNAVKDLAARRKSR